MKIALLHNLAPDNVAAADDTFAEYDDARTIGRVAEALRGLDLDVRLVSADRRLPWRLDDGGYGFVFNLAEGAGGRCREAVPAAVCELLGIPYSGSDPLTLAVTLDKAIARRVVSPDVPVARGLLVDTHDAERGLVHLRYPVLAKPNDEGSSKGIHDGALAWNDAAAAERCRSLHARYGCAVLVEEFLPGAEITVGIVGNGASASVAGMMEIAPVEAGKPFVYSREVKRDWRRRVRYHIPPRIDRASGEAIERLALTAYRILGCRDFARIDFRLDREGEPRFLECNPLPGLDPDNSDFVLLARERYPYDALVQTVYRQAAARVAMSVR